MHSSDPRAPSSELRKGSSSRYYKRHVGGGDEGDMDSLAR
jgi:hypothetical protein